MFETLDFGMGAEDAALWFGVLVLIVVEVGLITPPVGMNLFVINKIAKDVPLSESFKGVLPFVASDLIRVVLLTAFRLLHCRQSIYYSHYEAKEGITHGKPH